MSFPPVLTRLLVPVLLVLAAPAAAAARPTVSFTLPSTADAGAPINASWTAQRVPHGARLAVQRQQGTAHAWRTVVKLTGPGGAVALPALPLGTYRLRVAALGRHGRVYAQQQRAVAVFGAVPLVKLFRGLPGVDTTGGSYATPTRTFTWVFRSYPESGPSFTIQHNHCRSIHFDVVPGGGDYGTPDSDHGNVTLVQETLDPQAVSIQKDVIGAMDAQLVPGQSWAVDLDDDLGASLTFYFNGSASCDSARPFS